MALSSPRRRSLEGHQLTGVETLRLLVNVVKATDWFGAKVRFYAGEVWGTTHALAGSRGEHRPSNGIAKGWEWTSGVALVQLFLGGDRGIVGRQAIGCSNRGLG